MLEGNRESLQIRVIGELVTETCPDLREMVIETCAREPRHITLDLQQVPFIDTSGLGVLVGLRAHLKSRNIELRLARPSPRVRQVLEMTRLISVFGIKDSE